MTNKACWICGGVADSAEHAIKKTDAVRIAGSKRFKPGKRLIKHTAGKKIIIQGPDSKHIKYEKSLCKKCNNESTQPYDKAYDIFIDYVISSSDHLQRFKCMRFNKIYNYSAAHQQSNLFKYFVKSFGCQLVEQSLNVPQDLVSVLNGRATNHQLYITFSVRDEIPKNRESFFKFYEVHDLEGFEDSHTGKNVSFQWAASIGWVQISFWYKCVPKKHLGTIWQGKSKRLFLGQC